MPLPGHAVVVEASLDDAAYTEVDGIEDGSWAPTRDIRDVTDLKDADAARRKFGLLRDGQITLNGHYEADANGQGRLRAKFEDAGDLWLRIKWDPTAAGGSQGYKVKTIVQDYSIDFSRDDVVTVSYTCTWNALPVAV